MQYKFKERPYEEHLLDKPLFYFADEEDYVLLEELKTKNAKTPLISLALLFSMTAVTAYEFYKTNNPDVIGVLAAVLLVYFLSAMYRKFLTPEKRVKKYIDKDPQLTAYKEATFHSDRVEFRIYDDKFKEVVFRAIYPYALMDAIFVTSEEFYFVLGNQIKIFPRKFAQIMGSEKDLLDAFRSSGKMMDVR